MNRLAKAAVIFVLLSVALFAAIIIFGGASMKMDAIRANEHAVQVKEAISKRSIIAGMTREEAVQSWGEPKRKTVSGGTGVSTEQWVYEGTYLYFRDGRLVSWTQTR